MADKYSSGMPIFIVNPSTGEASEIWPDAIVTSGGIDGVAPRVRVDVAQTGLFEGKEFRMFKRFALAAAAVEVIKVVVPVNTLVFGVDVSLKEGEVELSTMVGGTEGGTFSTPITALPRNTMTGTPVYSPQVVLSSGGTHTGGTELDVIISKTGNNSNFSSSVGASIQDERGIGPGTYYFKITNTGSVATSGVVKARWEERP